MDHKSIRACCNLSKVHVGKGKSLANILLQIGYRSMRQDVIGVPVVEKYDGPNAKIRLGKVTLVSPNAQAHDDVLLAMTDNPDALREAWNVLFERGDPSQFFDECYARFAGLAPRTRGGEVDYMGEMQMALPAFDWKVDLVTYHPESNSAHGRADLVIVFAKTNRIMIIEGKYVQSDLVWQKSKPAERKKHRERCITECSGAIEQIDAAGYLAKYRPNDPEAREHLIRVGVVFSGATRNIACWQVKGKALTDKLDQDE
jgi:hypothetical protein